MRTKKFYDGAEAEEHAEAGGGRVTSMVGYHGTLVAQAIATSKKKSNGSAKVCHAGSPSPTAISLKETSNFLAAQQFHIGAESNFKVTNLIYMNFFLVTTMLPILPLFFYNIKLKKRH